MKLLLLLSACLIASAWTRSLSPIRPRRSIGSRVVGGNNAMAGQFPFAAAIDITTNNGRYFCGGTLISNQWVCTAAQCIDGAILFSLRIGSTSLTKTDANRVTVATSEYTNHPEYNPTTLENDIGLIRLRLPIEFSNYVLPVHSLAENPLESYTRVVVLGWGQISDQEPDLSDDLKYIAVTSLTNEECRLTYGNQIVDNMVCVEGNYNEGACNGDTGSPLILIISQGNAQLAGVSSFISGNGCESTDPSGYTRVYSYEGWMKNQTGMA